MSSMRQFRAFISYCHADRAFAAKLQHRLESYRLPRQLAPRLAPIADESLGRLGPVFRDRADLSADEDLSRAVRAAIASSSALVVVASPDAARSHWVAREIELFRELHPQAPILVALIRGEPDDALPAALRVAGREPLAADFRREGDGDRLAFLKIVGGLAALPLDALVQRDAQRQLRRVTAVTLGAAVLVVVMGLLLVMALQARQEADRRRAGAEGLVQYMQTSLRGRLKGLGNLEIMRAVNERALDYFDEQGVANLSDDSLLLRAQALQGLAEDAINHNDLATASARLDDAFPTTAALLSRRPADANTIYTHAQSEFWVGLVAWSKRDRAIATKHWKAYFRQAQSLVKAEPGSVRSLMELGYAYGDLCELDLDKNYDLTAAERECSAALRSEQQALTAQDKVVAHSPAERKEAESDTMRSIQEALANRYGWLARVRMASNDPAGALAARGPEAELLDTLIEHDPHNAEFLLRRSWADIGKADASIALGAPGRAVAVLRACLKRNAERFATSSADRRVTETKFRVHLFLAKALALTGQNNAADLAEADRLEAEFGASGPDFIAKAKAIRASIRPMGGEK